METQKSIEFDDVSFRLPDGRTLLSDLTLQVNRGETLVLLGRSGSGKTTTMKLINRLIDPTEGEVRVEGKSTLAWDPIQLRRRIGYVIQEIGLFPHLTVEENVGVVPRLEGWARDQITARARELLMLVGLDPDRFASRFPRELSGGQRQRVGVARAIAADPPVILLDEPFGALDPITRREIQKEFRSLQERLRKTMVFAILIGVLLGILLTRRPNLSKPVLGFANIMQTVPSLALFGFLIPLNIYLFHVRILGGIGARTAIVALVLYALLPIIRNTFIGISGVDPAIREAGRGMGMTDRQLLFQVELPLALGVIIAGIRVATVICVGTATIAAAIDAGGLGRYIFRGLRMNDNVLILAGAVPAALIALAADLLLGYVERLLQAGDAIRRESRKILWTAGLVFAVVGIFTVMNLFHGKTSGRVAVGSKDFTEQVILG